jgi:hypothetical protein
MSKKYFGTVFLLALLFCAFFKVSAQEDAFKEEDLTSLIKTATQKLEGKTYRSTSFYLVYKNGSTVPDITEKRIREILPPDREHVVTESETGFVKRRFEYIRIGDKFYTKADNEEWKLGGLGIGAGGGSGNGIGDVKIERSVERTFKKGEIVSNQVTDFYEMKTTTKYIYPTRTYLSVTKYGYWFDANGRFVKTETEYESESAKTLSRSKTEYEYDPKIKIEAPVLSRETKPAQ